VPYSLLLTGLGAVVGANSLGSNNGKASGKAENKTINKSDYVVTRAYCRKAVNTKPIAYNKGI
jgi:hypothetical protein